jgi:hypothetical protein
VTGSGPVAPAAVPGLGMEPEETHMKTSQIAELIALSRRLPDWSPPDILLARKLALKIHRADEAQCNGTAWEDDAGEWRDARNRPTRNPYGRAIRTLDALVAQHAGWGWHHQRDPRGRAVYLIPPDLAAEMEARGLDVAEYYDKGVGL